MIKETSVGRIIVNELVPDECGYLNTIISKKSLRDIISDVIKTVGVARACEFLDGIKNLGYKKAFEGGLSFNLGDIIIPKEKEELVKRGNEEVEQIMMNYNMGFITDNERYNQVIDTWTHVNSDLSDILYKTIKNDDQGFNSVFMMLDSGARGSKEQIRQLSGMRGLMAKPQKAGAEGAQIIENPILSNFKEGLSVLEYFISTHGARKGLADTALKTADAGYLTRRLVDVSHDVIINEEDCGTLRGLVCTALKNNDEVIATLYERILGRVSVHDVIHPTTGKLIVAAGEEITESIAQEIEDSPIESVEIRSVLTCESKKGVCAKCYGRNLATSRMVQKGEAVYLDVSPSNISATAEGGKFTFTVNSNTQYTFTCSDNSWISVDGNLIVIGANTSTSQRKGNVTVRAAELVRVIEITQAGKKEETPSAGGSIEDFTENEEDW